MSAPDGAAAGPAERDEWIFLPGGWSFHALPWPNGDRRDPEDMVFDLMTPDGDLMDQEWELEDARAFAAALAGRTAEGGAGDGPDLVAVVQYIERAFNNYPDSVLTHDQQRSVEGARIACRALRAREKKNA